MAARALASLTGDPGLPAVYLHLLADIVHAKGVDEQALLHAVGLDANRLVGADLRVSQAQAADFVRRAIMATGEPGLGILLAEELRLPLHGVVGTAVMSSRNLADALDVLGRFLSLRAPLLTVRTQMMGDQLIMTIEPRMDLGPLHGFIMDAMIVGCAMMGEQLLGAPLAGAAIWRRGREPAYMDRYRKRIPVAVRYEKTIDALVLPCDLVKAPIRFCDELAARISREQCEHALQRLQEDAGFATRVRRVVETGHPFPPKLTRVAATLFVSERTLKRRLQEETTSFQAQVDSVRLERAAALLVNTRLQLNQIADALGYADAANFTRAFRRWTGLSPSQFRSERALSL